MFSCWRRKRRHDTFHPFGSLPTDLQRYVVSFVTDEHVLFQIPLFRTFVCEFARKWYRDQHLSDSTQLADIYTLFQVAGEQLTINDVLRYKQKYLIHLTGIHFSYIRVFRINGYLRSSLYFDHKDVLYRVIRKHGSLSNALRFSRRAIVHTKPNENELSWFLVLFFVCLFCIYLNC